jgi:Protein of unknown function (DUF3225)
MHGPEVNRPDVLAEVEKVFKSYERALTENVVDDLTAMFWDSDLTLRYGSAEMLYGAKAIHDFRAARPSGPRPRELLKFVITTYGDSAATANAEFRVANDPRLGRQSQTWIKFADGWRIVAAHVSFMDEPDKP